jgi:CheY-specific phosphatase CheX
MPAATRRALVIERLGGPLNDLTPTIQALGYEIVRAGDASTLVRLVGSLRRLSVVLVNGDVVRAEPVRLVTTLKERHPDLPILWLQAKSKLPAHLRTKIDWIGEDIQKLESRIVRMGRSDFYSPKFIDNVIASTQAVLADFGWQVQPSDPCIKSSLSTLREVTAFLHFYGATLTGQVLASASMGDVDRIYRQHFPSATPAGRDDIEDFLGETANQIAGQIKRFLPEDVADCRMGMPYFIRGDGAGFRRKAAAPSLIVEFNGSDQKMQFELCLHGFEDKRPPLDDGEHGLKPGVVNFL